MNFIMILANQSIHDSGSNLKKMQKIILSSLFIMHYQLDATVKVFINNSSRKLLVRVYDNKNNIVALNLAPGAVQEAFLQGEIIEKIVAQDQKHDSRPLSSMTRHTLRKETSKINDNMVFIINQDCSIKMYEGSTSRDEALRKIDVAFIKHAQLPTIELSIHAIKTDQPWITQKVDYSLKTNKSFLSSIESLFS